MPGEMIALPFDGRYMMFDVDKLQTAMLIMMDVGGEYPENLQVVAARLRDEHSFARQDYILYPVGAAIAISRGILMD